MGTLADGRARMIARFGRPLVLSRPVGGASITVAGYAPPAQIASAEDGTPVVQFEAQIGVLPAAYGAPRRDDRLKDGAKTYTLSDAAPVYDGADLCGWTLIAAGGA